MTGSEAWIAGARAQFVAVVPVKNLADAKTRLRVDEVTKRLLALSFAVDTVASVSACPLVGSIVVVTSDATAAKVLTSGSTNVVDDPGRGLAAAVASGWAAAAATAPRRPWVVVVPADLPALRPDDLSCILASAVTAGGGFVPDASGTGTTLVAAPSAHNVARYGPGSASAHRRRGLAALVASARARRDVDTVDDLVEALSLGVGAATARVATAAGLSPGHGPRGLLDVPHSGARRSRSSVIERGRGA